VPQIQGARYRNELQIHQEAEAGAPEDGVSPRIQSRRHRNADANWRPHFAYIHTLYICIYMGMVYIGVYLQTGCGERAKYLSILTFQIRCGSLWKRVWKLGQWHSMHGILRLRLCICIFYCSRSRICEVHIHTNIYIYMYISPTTVWASFLRHFFGLSLALSSAPGFLCGQYNDSARLAGSV